MANKLTKAEEKGLMIAHGNKIHKYGKPCKVCEKIHADNPYVKRLLATQKKEIVEKLEKKMKTAKHRSEIAKTEKTYKQGKYIGLRIAIETINNE